MKSKTDRRAFNAAVLAELAEAYRAVLRKRRVGEPDATVQDLPTWADEATETRSKGKHEEERWKIYKDVCRSGVALRDIRAIKAAMDSGDEQLVDAIYRLLFVCGEMGDFLKELFTGKGHAAARARGHRAKSERYLDARLPLVKQASVKLAAGLSMKEAALQVIRGLGPDEWDKLTQGKKRGKKVRLTPKTDESIDWQARKLAKLLGIWEGIETTEDGDEAVTEFDWSSVSWQIMSRQIRELAIPKYVSKHPFKSYPGASNREDV